MDRPVIYLPDGAYLLSFQAQHGGIYLWALVDPDAPKNDMEFQILATGEPFTLPVSSFLATVQIEGLVWHVFGPPGCKLGYERRR